MCGGIKIISLEYRNFKRVSLNGSIILEQRMRHSAFGHPLFELLSGKELEIGLHSGYHPEENAFIPLLRTTAD